MSKSHRLQRQVLEGSRPDLAPEGRGECFVSGRLAGLRRGLLRRCDRSRQMLDLSLGAFLSHGHEQAILPLRIPTPSGTPAKTPCLSAAWTARSQTPAGHAHHELLERGPVKRRHNAPRPPVAPSHSAALCRHKLGHLPQTGGPDGRQVDRRAQGQQALVRADVARRLLAANVLLARLQREHPATIAAPVDRLPDEPARACAARTARGRPGCPGRARRRPWACPATALRRRRCRPRSPQAEQAAQD